MEELVQLIKMYFREVDYHLNTDGDYIKASFIFGKAEALADVLWRNYSEDIMNHFPEYTEKASTFDYELFEK